MCLGIPALVTEMGTGPTCWVDVGGARRRVNISLIDENDLEVRPGDWVLVHVGFALCRLDADEARATLALLEEMEAAYSSELEALAASESANAPQPGATGPGTPARAGPGTSGGPENAGPGKAGDLRAFASRDERAR